MSVLVLGGAGYIGSHTVDRLVDQGQDVVVVDSLVTGHRAAVNDKAKFYQGDLADQDFMRKVFTENPEIDAVIHFAAYSLVAESMKKPLKYFDNNTAGMIKLLEVMNEFDIKNIVFSSTAATYGIPEKMPIMESDPQDPINPYGESKLMMEKIMRWADEAYGTKFVALRYFNVAGAKPDGSIGEDHGPETHLIPIVLQVAQGKRDKLQIFGDDYNMFFGSLYDESMLQKEKKPNPLELGQEENTLHAYYESAFQKEPTGFKSESGILVRYYVFNKEGEQVATVDTQKDVDTFLELHLDDLRYKLFSYAKRHSQVGV